MRTYTVVLTPDLETHSYSVSVPALPGALSQGANRDEALANIRKAMEGWLEVASEHGEDGLEETPALVLEDIAFILGWRAEEGWPLLVETAQVSVAIPVPA